jgi:outer membrane protein assembly factor BamB
MSLFLRSAALAAITLTAAWTLAVPPQSAAPSAEWSSWRGPSQNGVSPATNLLTDWTVDGPGQAWRADWIGRSTPVVFHGRVCANGRRGSGADEQATVACWDAGTGEMLWERRFNIFNSTVPFTRVGWGSVAGDPETGNLYVLNVDGWFHALDAAGQTVWQIRLHEDHGRFSGYGGRTLTPVIDENRVLLPIINTSWAEFGPPRQRFYAFDKYDGRVLWVSNPSEEPEKDKNIQSVPIVTEIDGQRLMIVGGADGWIYALQARTGAFVWKFQLSKRGINVSVVEHGGIVYAAHSEENVDEGILGRVVAINGRGRGDITRTHELWRATEVPVGFSSPLLHDGTLYVVDNSANLIAFDAETGQQRWHQNVGNVGKSSPVWADGKIYLTEVNGNFIILRPGTDGAEVLDTEFIAMPDGRYAEIYGSPAIAYGRIYFSSEAGLFALGDPDAPVQPEAPGPGTRSVTSVDAHPTTVRVVPGEVTVRAGQPAQFEVHAFDADGNFIRARRAVYSLVGLEGEVSDEGVFYADPASGNQVGRVVATAGGMETAYARVRVLAPGAQSEDFNDGVRPAHWIGGGRFATAELEGEPVLIKRPSPSGIHRQVAYTADAVTNGVTVQVDLFATGQRRRRPDGGVVNSGYTLDLQGNHQRLEIRAWASELRMMQRTPFAWEIETWYTVKLRVDQASDRAIVRAKVWPRDEPEPAAWTLQVEDMLPIRNGAPGLYGFSPVDIYFDNYKVMVNQ